jgi:hypothetical protein
MERSSASSSLASGGVSYVQRVEKAIQGRRGAGQRGDRRLALL